jgi:hypothetical protein
MVYSYSEFGCSGVKKAARIVAQFDELPLEISTAVVCTYLTYLSWFSRTMKIHPHRSQNIRNAISFPIF